MKIRVHVQMQFSGTVDGYYNPEEGTYETTECALNKGESPVLVESEGPVDSPAVRHELGLMATVDACRAMMQALEKQVHEKGVEIERLPVQPAPRGVQ